MKTKRLIIILLCISASLCHSAAANKPNIILIFADDLGYGDLGCYGNPVIRTPNLDQLAKEGMRFTHFYAQPICGPSRAALMTGCQPMRVAEAGNVKNVHPVLHTREITIAEVLKPRGYASICIGKWDLAGHSQRGFVPDLLPTRQGFDEFFGTPTSNDAFVDLFRIDRPPHSPTPIPVLTVSGAAVARDCFLAVISSRIRIHRNYTPSSTMIHPGP